MADKLKQPKKADKTSEKPSKSEKKPTPKPSPAKESKPQISSASLRKIISAKDTLSPEGKEKLLQLLQFIKTKKVEVAAEGALQEDGGFGGSSERNPIAKIEKTRGDLETYAAQKQRIQFTDKELQAIIGFTERAQPVQQDKFIVKYDTTDGGGANLSTIVQKEREGQVFNFVAYSKKENSEGEPNVGDEPEKGDGDHDDGGRGDMPDLGDLKENNNPAQGQEVTSEDHIVITKSITFSDDNQSSDILADFLRKLEI